MAQIEIPDAGDHAAMVALAERDAAELQRVHRAGGDVRRTSLEQLGRLSRVMAALPPGQAMALRAVYFSALDELEAQTRTELEPQLAGAAAAAALRSVNYALGILMTAALAGILAWLIIS